MMEQNINRHIPHIQYSIIVCVVSCFILYTYRYIVIICSIRISYRTYIDILWPYHSESLNTCVCPHGLGAVGEGEEGH